MAIKVLQPTVEIEEVAYTHVTGQSPLHIHGSPGIIRIGNRLFTHKMDVASPEAFHRTGSASWAYTNGILERVGDTWTTQYATPLHACHQPILLSGAEHLFLNYVPNRDQVGPIAQSDPVHLHLLRFTRDAIGDGGTELNPTLTGNIQLVAPVDCTGSNWTPNPTTGGAIHDAGHTDALSALFAPVTGVTYDVVIRLFNSSTGDFLTSGEMSGHSHAITFGGQTHGHPTAVSNVWTVTALSTAPLVFTPSSNMPGEVRLQVFPSHLIRTWTYRSCGVDPDTGAICAIHPHMEVPFAPYRYSYYAADGTESTGTFPLPADAKYARTTTPTQYPYDLGPEIRCAYATVIVRGTAVHIFFDTEPFVASETSPYSVWHTYRRTHFHELGLLSTLALNSASQDGVDTCHPRAAYLSTEDITADPVVWDDYLYIDDIENLRGTPDDATVRPGIVWKTDFHLDAEGNRHFLYFLSNSHERLNRSYYQHTITMGLTAAEQGVDAQHTRFTTASHHIFLVGNTVVIAGFSHAGHNGSHVITAVGAGETPTTFEIAHDYTASTPTAATAVYTGPAADAKDKLFYPPTGLGGGETWAGWPTEAIWNAVMYARIPVGSRTITRTEVYRYTRTVGAGSNDWGAGKSCFHVTSTGRLFAVYFAQEGYGGRNVIQEIDPATGALLGGPVDIPLAIAAIDPGHVDPDHVTGLWWFFTASPRGGSSPSDGLDMLGWKYRDAPTFTIDDAADNGNGYTRFRTTTAHVYQVGDPVWIQGMGIAAYNDCYRVSGVPDSTHFDIEVAFDADDNESGTVSLERVWYVRVALFAEQGSASPSSTSSVSASPSASPSVSASRSASRSGSRSASASPSPAPPEKRKRKIRRLRQAAHLADAFQQLSISAFELDVVTGHGAVVGQGIDPQIMLQWSNDGGHTWSDERWVSAGALGQYAWRAIWRRLGKARKRTWRVVMTDPVKWAILEATVQMDKGTT